MSQHPSLKSSTKGKAHRSVWKRFERLKFLMDKDKWSEGNSIFGLPKMKLLKLKIKKEKTEASAEATAAEGAVAAEGVATTEGVKGEAAPAKEASKEEIKKAKPEKGGKK